MIWFLWACFRSPLFFPAMLALFLYAQLLEFFWHAHKTRNGGSTGKPFAPSWLKAVVAFWQARADRRKRRA